MRIPCTWHFCINDNCIRECLRGRMVINNQYVNTSVTRIRNFCAIRNTAVNGHNESTPCGRMLIYCIAREPIGLIGNRHAPAHRQAKCTESLKKKGGGANTVCITITKDEHLFFPLMRKTQTVNCSAHRMETERSWQIA